MIVPQHTHGDLNALRLSVKEKDDAIPFLLLPVRVETRFMKVEQEQSSSETTSFTTLLHETSEVSKAMTDDSTEPGSRSLDEGSAPLESLASKLARIKTLSLTQRKELGSLITRMETNLARKPQARGKDPRGEAIRGLRKQLREKPVHQDPTYKDGRILLRQHRRLLNRVSMIVEDQEKGIPKMPYTHPSNKKQLYGYLNRLLSEIQRFYRKQNDRFARVQDIQQKQLEKLQKQHKQLKKILPKTAAALKEVHPDANWQAWVKGWAQNIDNTLPDLFEHFEAQQLARLEFAESLKKKTADEVYLRGVRTQIWIDDYRERPFKRYSDVKMARIKVTGKLETFWKALDERVEADAAQVKSLRKLAKTMAKSLSGLAGKIEKMEGANRSQQYGIDHTVKTLRDEVARLEKRLGALRPGSTTQLKQEDIFRSASFYQKALDAIAGLEGHANKLEKKDKPDEKLISALNKKLRHFADLILGQAQNKLVLPAKARKNLTRRLKKLEKRLKTEPFAQVQELAGPIQLSKALNDLAIVVDPENRATLRRKGKAEKAARALDLKTVTETEDTLIISAASTLQDELWVRIFPDDLFVHSHEEALSAEEQRRGKEYWMAYWAASGDADLELGAWKALCAALGSQRATWVSRQLKPDPEGPFQQRPSAVTLSGLRDLEHILEETALITEDNSIGAIFENLEPAVINEYLDDLKGKLEGLSFEQAYLLEKLSSSLFTFETRLSIMQQKVAALNEDEADSLASELEEIALWFDTYPVIHDNLANVEARTSRAFIDSFEDPFPFPVVSEKDEEWSMAPQARVLPNRFAVIAQTGGITNHVAIGNALPAQPLQLGIDPAKFDQDDVYQVDAIGNLIVDPEIKWMVDFHEAVAKGMALRIPLTAAEAQNGFDRLLVLGVREGEDGQARLEELLENHQYAPDGMELLPINTPTNNTEDGSSAYGGLVTDEERTFDLAQGPAQFTLEANDPLKMRDGQRLAHALGIRPEVFERVAGAGNSEIANALAINRALWPATLGYFMEDMLDSVMTYDNIERTKAYFTGNVTARGPVPSIRIGDQPYGILPAISTTLLRYSNIYHVHLKPPVSQPELRFDIRMQEFLEHLDTHWTQLRRDKVKYLGNVEGQNPQQHFMDMLGLHANSVDYFYRYGVNIAMRGKESEDFGFDINFRDDAPYGPTVLWDLFRHMMRDGVFTSSFKFHDETNPSSDIQEQINREYSRIRDQFRMARLFKSRFLDINPPVEGLLVADPNGAAQDALPPLNGSSDNYIQWLLSHNPYEILAGNQIDDLPSNAILFLLMRQALLMAYRGTALDILQQEGFFSERTQRAIGNSDKYRVFLDNDSPHFTYQSKWTYLFRDLKAINGIDFQQFDNRALYQHLDAQSQPKSMVHFLYPLQNNLFTSYAGHTHHEPLLGRISEVRAAMQHLSTVPAGALRQLLAEHLDLCTYRVDAWILGQANQRLAKQRAANPEGIHLGAYGWLEDLRPGGARNPATHVPAELQDENGQTIYTDEDNQGHIHAPSLNHATTAAILRGGYLANQEQPDLENNMAVNLSSRRVRAALALLEGIRNGLPLSASLGFQFERGLHERYADAELDEYILPFRQAFPQAIPVEETAAQNGQPAPETQVVNGQEILDHVNDNIDLANFPAGTSLYQAMTLFGFQHMPDKIYRIVAGTTPRASLSQAQTRALIAVAREIDRMMDSLDAIGDLAISESVYQVVQGNHVRAAATVQALAEGRAIPDPQIVHTPRTGTVITQRVVMHLSDQRGTPTAPPTWPVQLTARAKAEPALNHWVASWLHDATRIRTWAEFVDDGGTRRVHEVKMHELGIQPIDLLIMIGTGAGQGNGELTARIARLVRQVRNLSADVELKVNYRDRLGNWDETVKTITAVEAMLEPIAAMLTETRGVHAADLDRPVDDPDLDNPGRQDLPELEGRVLAAHGDLSTLVTDAETFLTDTYGDAAVETISFTQPDIAQMRQILAEAAQYGLPNAIPEAAIENTDAAGADLLRQIRTVLKAAGKRLTEASAVLARYQAPLGTQQKVSMMEELARIVFGKSFLVLPYYQPDNLQAMRDQLNLAPNQGLLRSGGAGKEQLTMSEWMQGIAEVRPGMGQLEMTEMLTETLGYDFPDFAPVQFPYHPQDYWVGTSYHPEESWSSEPGEEVLSLVMIDPARLQADASHRVGILLDEWLEIIPNTRETTGIAFNYDRPDAEAPQSIILAVTPKETGQWEWDALAHTLIDTLELAKNRAVEPDHLEESRFVQVLPALVSEVVPPQLRDISEDNPLGTQVVLDYADNMPTTEGQEA